MFDKILNWLKKEDKNKNVDTENSSCASMKTQRRKFEIFNVKLSALTTSENQITFKSVWIRFDNLTEVLYD